MYYTNAFTNRYKRIKRSTYYELVSRSYKLPVTKTEVEQHLKTTYDNWIYNNTAGNEDLLLDEDFSSQDETVLDGGVPTDVTYLDGIGTFNGSSSRISYSPTTRLNTVYTIVGRFKADVFVSGGSIYSERSDSSIFPVQDVTFDAGSSALFFQIKDDTNTSMSVISSSLATDTWYHFAAIRNGNNCELYIDGISMGTDSNTIGAITRNTANIGRAETTSIAYYDGDIDYVEIYDRVLTQQEIINSFNNITPIRKYSLSSDLTGLPLVTSYSDGDIFKFVPEVTNTGTLEMDVDGVGAKDMLKSDGSEFSGGDIKVGQVYTFQYVSATDDFRQTTGDEIDYLYMLIESIISVFEKIIKRDIFTKQYKHLRDGFDYEIELRRSPYQGLESFKYLSSDVLTDVDTDLFYVIEQDEYSRIGLKNNQQYPTPDAQRQNVQIIFNTGYGDDLDSVAYDLKEAILLTLASLDQYRGDCIGSANTSCYCSLSQIPPQANLILQKYKIEEIY